MFLKTQPLVGGSPTQSLSVARDGEAHGGCEGVFVLCRRRGSRGLVKAKSCLFVLACLDGKVDNHMWWFPDTTTCS